VEDANSGRFSSYVLMNTVIISPFSKKMKNGERNPKNYPHWNEVTRLLRENGISTVQVGVTGEESIGADVVFHNLTLEQLKNLLDAADTWGVGR
jgi:hypothetical protein